MEDSLIVGAIVLTAAGYALYRLFARPSCGCGCDCGQGRPGGKRRSAGPPGRCSRARDTGCGRAEAGSIAADAGGRAASL